SALSGTFICCSVDIARRAKTVSIRTPVSVTTLQKKQRQMSLQLPSIVCDRIRMSSCASPHLRKVTTSSMPVSPSHECRVWPPCQKSHDTSCKQNLRLLSSDRFQNSALHHHRPSQ